RRLPAKIRRIDALRDQAVFRAQSAAGTGLYRLGDGSHAADGSLPSRLSRPAGAPVRHRADAVGAALVRRALDRHAGGDQRGYRQGFRSRRDGRRQGAAERQQRLRRLDRGGMQDASPGRFVLRVAAWLPLAFLVWYLAGPVLAWPIALLTEGVARLAFRDLIQGVEQQGHLLTIVSTLKPALATTEQSVTGVISVEVNTLLYSFGLPMLAALILAAREPHP